MSVLMVINTTGLEYDDRLRKEAGTLKAIGVDVRILGIEYANRAGQSIVHGGVLATTLRLRSRGWFTRGRGIAVKTLEMYLRFIARIVMMRPAVVWCHDLEMGGLVPVLAFLRMCGWIQRIVWDQHELPSDALLRSRAYKALYAWLLRRCDMVVMASGERRALVIDWLGRPGVDIEVLENFPDAQFAESPSEALPLAVVEWLDGSPYLLAQGGANPDRHLDSLVAAVLGTPWLKLVVVGPCSPALAGDLERTHGARLGQRVLFTGSVPQLELPRYIDHAYASVILYRMDSENTRLCAPNRLYQALSRGVPVLVGANPPMARVVKELKCGVVLEGDGKDTDDLRRGIEALAAHPALKGRLESRRDFTWESQAPAIGRIVQSESSRVVRTVCLLPVATDARIHRRLAALARLGLEPTVLAFDRPYYPGKPLPGGYQSLGRIEHGRYGSRIKSLLAALPAVRAASAEADVVYAFSLDLLAIAWLATRRFRNRPRLVYEVADIHPTLVGGSLGARAMRAIERKLLRDTSLLVVTSEAFISGFYRGLQNLSDLKYQLIENKPDLETLSAQAPSVRPSDGTLTIGYFGVIRCERSWQALQRLAVRGGGRIRVYLRGVPLNIRDFEAEARACPWIEYGGPYVAPDDLPAMYDSVDVVWAAHRVDHDNSLLWNRTNRFYESCAFQKPMIGQIGTQDGTFVLDRDLGPGIDLMDPEQAIERILNITSEDVQRWQANVSHLPPSVYRENGEHEQLTMQIRMLANAV
jgi:succinoglycan biosynthesis protein ExoL